MPRSNTLDTWTYLPTPPSYPATPPMRRAGHAPAPRPLPNSRLVREGEGSPPVMAHRGRRICKGNLAGRALRRGVLAPRHRERAAKTPPSRPCDRPPGGHSSRSARVKRFPPGPPWGNEQAGNDLASVAMRPPACCGVPQAAGQRLRAAGRSWPGEGAAGVPAARGHGERGRWLARRWQVL